MRPSFRHASTALAAALALSTLPGCETADGELADPDPGATTTSVVSTASPAPAAAAEPGPAPIWGAGFEGYAASTVLDPASHAASLTPEKLLGWSNDLRLTVISSSTGFADGKALLVNGPNTGASNPALAFGDLAPGLGSGNGSDVAVLGFDAWFEVEDGNPAVGYAELGTAAAPGTTRLTDLVFPSRRIMRVTLAANRSGVPLRLPDLDNDGEIDDDEILQPDQATVYYRTASGLYGKASAGPVALASAAYTRIGWNMRYGNRFSAIYDDLQLANDPTAEVRNNDEHLVPLLEAMPGRISAPFVDGDAEDEDRDLTISYFDDGLEDFEPFLSREDSGALRRSFDWASAPAWPEGTDDRPAVYYAMLYADDPEIYEALDQLQVHWDALPLFASEVSRYEGRKGVFDHEPDTEGGQWIYTLMPAAAYNLIRDEALNGNPIFPAIIRRDVPDASAVDAAGAIRYEWLANQAITYGPDVLEDEANLSPDPVLKEHPDSDDASNSELNSFRRRRRARRWLKRKLRQAVNRAKDAVDHVREKTADLVQIVAPEVNVAVDMTVYNSDEKFNRETPLVRGWKPGIGTALTVPGIEVRITQGRLLLHRARLNKDGKANIKVIKGLKTRICFEMANHAAELSTFLLPVQVCDFSGHNLGRVKGNRHAHIRLRHGYANILAQMTDAYAYMDRVGGKAMHRAQVLVGKLANVFSQGASYAPCLDFHNSRLQGLGLATEVGTITVAGTADSVLVAAGLPPLGTAAAAVAIPALQFAKLVVGVDIILRRDDKHNRVATHEYGHFVLCSLMASKDLRLFQNVNADIVLRTIAGGRSTGEDVLSVNEGFADYISSQVSGGVNYWTPLGSVASDGIHYCDPTVTTCIEDNIGGTFASSPTPTTEQRLDTSGLLAIQFEAAQVATYMNDISDSSTTGGSVLTNNGAAFRLVSGFLTAVTAGGLGRTDESVALGTGWLGQFIDQLHEQRSHASSGVTWRLKRPQFFQALNDVIKAQTSKRSACQVCELHLDNRFCEQASFSTFPCATNTVTTSVTGGGKVKLSTSGLVSVNNSACTSATGATACTGTYEKFGANNTSNVNVTLTAIPNSGQMFTSWSGACTGTSVTCVVSSAAARTATANFVVAGSKKITLTVKDGGGTGRVTSNPAGFNCASSTAGTVCERFFPGNTQITLTPVYGTADIISWRGVHCTNDHTESKCVFTLTANLNIEASFGVLL
jgi:hypothetical protein